MAVFLPDEQQYIDRLTAIVEDHLSDASFGVAELAHEIGISVQYQKETI